MPLRPQVFQLFRRPGPHSSFGRKLQNHQHNRHDWNGQDEWLGLQKKCNRTKKPCQGRDFLAAVNVQDHEP
jgi:hypothetical protein